MTTNGMVACSQPLASQAGLHVLQLGGNAIDASIAVAAVLAVVEPCSNGIGGDFFLLAYCRRTRAIAALNGSGRCPSGLTLSRAQAVCDTSAGRQPDRLPETHAFTVTVPGAVQAWLDAVESLGSGRVSLREILAPAIALADHGFPVAPVTAHHWRLAEELLRTASPHGGELLTPSGRAPRAGEVFFRPTLANVLRHIAFLGRDGFYGGPVASSIVEAVNQAGGAMAEEDLEEHTSEFQESVCTLYRGTRVWECPPNGGGVTALLALNILTALEEAGQLAPADAPDAEDEGAAAEAAALRAHAQIEALRLAYADTSQHIGDPEWTYPVVSCLLSKPYAEQRARLFQPAVAMGHVEGGAPRAESCTVSFQVVDGSGNATSVAQSNYLGFGTGIVPQDCGFTLQNRGLNFSLDPASPNALGPGRRPYHTILPCVITDAGSGDLVASITNMGGFMQPQGHVQLIDRLLREGLSPQEAVDAPRFCVLPLALGTSSCASTVALEDTWPPAVVDKLRERGHNLRIVSGHDRVVVGRAQIITAGPGGVLSAGSDGRADGCAAGF